MTEPVIVTPTPPPPPTPNPGGELRVKYSAIISLVLISAVALGSVEGIKWVYHKVTSTPTLELPQEIKGQVGQIIPITAQGTASDVRWSSSDRGLSIADRSLLSDPNTILVASSVPGTYIISAHGSLHNHSTDIATTRVTISGVGPTPPIPPGPIPVPPGPKPPDPTPPGPPAPIPGDGLRVLMVYESAELSKMPAAQNAALYSKQVENYLNSHCPPGVDGKTKDWRIWDKDVDTSGEAKIWQDAMKRPWGGAPWIIISNGKTGYEGKLPATEADLLTLIKTYGGQ